MNSKIILVRLHWALLQSLVYAFPERKRLFRDLTHLVRPSSDWPLLLSKTFGRWGFCILNIIT